MIDLRRLRLPKALVVWTVLLLAAAAPLVACWGPEYESVHFNDARPDFLRMPRPWSLWPGEVRALISSERERQAEEKRSGPEAEEPEARLARTEKAARALEAAGRFREAADEWERYCRVRREVPGEGGEWGADRAGAPRGVEVRIRALRRWRRSVDTAPLRTYLKARDLVSEGKSQEAEPLLASLAGVPYQPDADYLRACASFYQDRGAGDAFRTLVRRWPRDPSGHYMLGRTYFRLAGGQNDHPLSPEMLQWALASFQKAQQLEPEGPLAASAGGLAAACEYHLGHYDRALLEYCRELARLGPGDEDPAAAISARWCLGKMSLADHRALQAAALAEPKAAAIYLDLHLHYQRTGQRADYNLGLFALEVLKRKPDAPVAGRLLGRLAALEDRLGHPDRALRLADAAVQRLSSGIDRDQARWTRALALHHLGRSREALAGYEAVAAGAGAPRLRTGAHEAAAVLSEQLGDRANAIRHYFALGYRDDFAYVIDCLATQEDLRSFLARFPDHSQARLVRYSLGFRQLRVGEHEAAEKTFASLGPWLDAAEAKYDCETSKDGKRWPPLRAARFLGDAERREAAAGSEAEKARIAYEAARAVFHQRHLMFYNGALWEGGRTFAMELHWPHNVREGSGKLDPAEEKALDRYQEEHAALYQALRRFERIAEKYPHTPEAPKALYSAALCCTMLPSLESYWSLRRKEDFYGRAISFYRRIQRDYPQDPLAADARKWGGPLPPPRRGKK